MQQSAERHAFNSSRMKEGMGKQKQKQKQKQASDKGVCMGEKDAEELDA